MITIIIPTLNAQDTIKQCLESVKEYPVIIIDKDSDDKTIEIASKFDNVKIYQQKDSGIASARNLALKFIKTPYVMNLGSDNALYNFRWTLTRTNKLEDAITYMENQKWVGIGFLTRVKSFISYWDDAMDYWFFKKIKMGECKVIGTPNIFKTEILKKYMYDDKCKFCDDSDLGERMAKDGHKVGYGSFYALDIQRNNYKVVKKRWQMYAKSDIQYHNKYKKQWGLLRRLKSYLHSLTADWMGWNLYYLPFWFLIAFIRFTGRFYLKGE